MRYISQGSIYCLGRNLACSSWNALTGRSFILQTPVTFKTHISSTNFTTGNCWKLLVGNEIYSLLYHPRILVKLRFQTSWRTRSLLDKLAVAQVSKNSAPHLLNLMLVLCSQERATCLSCASWILFFSLFLALRFFLTFKLIHWQNFEKLVIV